MSRLVRVLAGVGVLLVDPGSGIGWIGDLEEEVDLVYPVVGLALGLLAAAIAHRTGATQPSPENSTPVR